MYGRKIGKRTLTFGHEGVLYRRSFVMYDHSTDSLWLHVTGEAIKGKLKGKRLDFLPSEVTTWEDWKERHPETEVLLGRRARGPMGHFGLTAGIRHYGVSVGEGRVVRLYPYETLAASPILNTTWGDDPLVIVYDPETLRTAAYEAKVGTRTLTFEKTKDEPRVHDVETDSTWDLRRGVAVDGKLKGKQLERRPATPWLIERWKAFFPDGEIVRAIRSK